MATVVIGQYTYALSTNGGYDYASSQGTYYFYRQSGTTQWLTYTQAASSSTTTQARSSATNTQAGSSSGGTVPAIYSYRLASNEYEGTIRGINIRWGPTAVDRLQTSAAAREISLTTLKALSEHFVYLMAARITALGTNISTATIKSSPHNFTEDTTTQIFIFLI